MTSLSWERGIYIGECLESRHRDQISSSWVIGFYVLESVRKSPHQDPFLTNVSETPIPISTIFFTVIQALQRALQKRLTIRTEWNRDRHVNYHEYEHATTNLFLGVFGRFAPNERRFLDVNRLQMGYIKKNCHGKTDLESWTLTHQPLQYHFILDHRQWRSSPFITLIV